MKNEQYLPNHRKSGGGALLIAHSSLLIADLRPRLLVDLNSRYRHTGAAVIWTIHNDFVQNELKLAHIIPVGPGNYG
jgi:hypothetical protein